MDDDNTLDNPEPAENPFTPSVIDYLLKPGAKGPKQPPNERKGKSLKVLKEKMPKSNEKKSKEKIEGPPKAPSSPDGQTPLVTPRRMKSGDNIMSAKMAVGINPKQIKIEQHAIIPKEAQKAPTANKPPEGHANNVAKDLSAKKAEAHNNKDNKVPAAVKPEAPNSKEGHKGQKAETANKPEVSKEPPKAPALAAAPPPKPEGHANNIAKDLSTKKVEAQNNKDNKAPAAKPEVHAAKDNKAPVIDPKKVKMLEVDETQKVVKNVDGKKGKDLTKSEDVSCERNPKPKPSKIVTPSLKTTKAGHSQPEKNSPAILTLPTMAESQPEVDNKKPLTAKTQPPESGAAKGGLSNRSTKKNVNKGGKVEAGGRKKDIKKDFSVYVEQGDPPAGFSTAADAADHTKRPPLPPGLGGGYRDISTKTPYLPRK